MANSEVRTLVDALDQLGRDLQFINNLVVAVAPLRMDDVDAQTDTSKRMNPMFIAVNRAAPTFIYLKLVAFVQKLTDLLWKVTPGLDGGRPVTKRAKQLELLAAKYGLNNDSLKMLSDLRNDIAHDIRYETDWESVDVALRHLSFAVMKLKMSIR